MGICPRRHPAGAGNIDNMPNDDAKRGDVYLVHRVAIPASTDPKSARPMACVAERPQDPVAWTAMPRLTHGQTAEDLPSDPEPGLHLSDAGWWTWRFLHSVRKAVTGKYDCRFRGTLEDPEKSRVLNHYRNRPRLR